ncbi:FkbM family methyltransferase [Sulfitobacter sp. JB4-11]|uniref:FkbM family methyltransferase n=1 Tax=Sulfitobacter rhodophyticola TaxID=3238304 RepID=UPI0035151975
MATETAIPPNYFVVSRGMNFPQHADFIQGRTRARLRRGVFEANEAEAALRTVRPGDVVLELGAGLGFMSTLMAMKRKVAAVHSYEPNPHLIPYIHTVHAANGLTDMSVTNGILGPRKAEVDFHLRPDLLLSSLHLEEDEADLPKTRIPVHNANSVFKEVRPTVLYCNMKGEEATLIPQLPLQGLRAAIIAFTPNRSSRDAMNTVFRALMDAGLAYYHRGSAGKVICMRSDW